MTNSRPPAAQGLWIAGIFFALFFAAYGLQQLIDPYVHYLPGIALVYLPAGVKLLAFVIGGAWGALGLLVAGVVTAPFVLGELDVPLSYLLLRTSLWVFAPFITFCLIKRWRGLNESLNGLTHNDMVLIGVGTTVTSVLSSLVYDALWFERAPELVYGAMLGMALGDILGIVLVLSATRWLTRSLPIPTEFSRSTDA